MTISLKTALNSEKSYKLRQVSQNSSSSGINNQSPSFKGKEAYTAKMSDLVKDFADNIGESAASHLESTIKKVVNNDKLGIKLDGDTLSFNNDSIGKRLNNSLLAPFLYLPVDAANSVLGGLNKFSFVKKSGVIDNILNTKVLKNRANSLEDFSSAMAVRNRIEVFDEISKLESELKSQKEKLTAEEIKNSKDIKALANKIEKLKERTFSESHKRLNPGISNYSTKTERTLTRIFTGIVPGFFLANDAYNLSIYMNDNKDLAKKEKKRRFNQEVARIGITAASMFAVMGFFAKKSNANSSSATLLVVATTFASEVIGRLLAGTPVYPISAKQAKKYAHLQQKDKELKKIDNKNASATQANGPSNLLEINKQNAKSAGTAEKPKAKKSNDALKLLGGLVALGLAVDQLPKHVRPLQNFLTSFNNRYKSIFLKDKTIKISEFNEIVSQLRKDDKFSPLAKKYEDIVAKIKKDGNFTASENSRIDLEIDKRIEKELAEQKNKFFFSKEKEADLKSKLKKDYNNKRIEIAKELKIDSREDSDVINVCGGTKKIKEIALNQIALFPVKVVWEIAMMPYRYIVKPVFDLMLTATKKIFWKNDVIQRKFGNNESFNNFMAKIGDFLGKPKPEKAKELTDNENLMNSLNYLGKIKNDKDYALKINKNIIDGFDNVNKSSLSSADLAGSAKTAVSTVTSAFLVFDNYNMVMVDSEGKDKELAGQKAKERIIQRIVRIAYGACLIKLFNGIFKQQYDSSLFKAQLVNVGNTMIVESLERTSVGLPIGESTRDNIIKKDKKNVETKGIIGAYYRMMAKLTGKRSLSEQAKK